MIVDDKLIIELVLPGTLKAYNEYKINFKILQNMNY